MNTSSEHSRFSRHPAVEALLAKVVREIENCAEKEMAQVPAPAIAALTDRVVQEVRRFAEGQVTHIYELVKIGLGLSSEKNIDRLFEMIVSEARRFTNADGGTLYIKDEDRQELDFTIVQNDSLKVFMGGSGESISWPSVPLRTRNNRDNHRNVSAYCALTGKAVNIHDVYSAKGFDFQGTKDFDTSTGYRSRSMLVIPMRDHEDEVIGVLQLLNARDPDSGAVVPFPEHEVDMVTSLASEAAIALTNMRLVRGLENFLDAFVRTIGDAIDQKSPHTAGHIFRVADFTLQIAAEVDRATTGKFREVSYSEDELAEIKMAAWLHDVGKITTPEHLMDKATKLETIFDRIELIRHRVELIQRAQCASAPRREERPPQLPGKKEEWLEIIDFLDRVNLGSESLSAESIARIRRLAEKSYEIAGTVVPLLAPDEVENLCVPQGTLTPTERKVMMHHVEMTIRMLERLPFPRKLRRVPVYAGMHHEKMNGGGYPRGLDGEELPLPARMLALADIFEALTAADRPYKRGKMLSESMTILAGMVARGELDGDLCDLAVTSGLISRFARENLARRQCDDFYWRGRRYRVSETR
ncbi:HD domain-containing phosphohydrolase [Thiovibrio sp. JS02]